MSARTIPARTLVVCALISSAATLPGCLISSHSDESLSGTYVSEPTFNRIEPGVTTRQWVLGSLGEPTLKTKLEDGGELWKWQYSKTKQSSGAVLFLFGGSSKSSTTGAAYVQFKDDVVTRSWRTD
jgi:outer membrane protein assembly factor BamE (lipoprotein component of BamABCDE complex)